MAELCSQNPVCGFDDLLYLSLQQQRTQIHPPVSSSSSSSYSASLCDNLALMDLSQSLEAHLERQRQEIDYFIHLQNEKLRFIVDAQTKRQLAILIQRMESRTKTLMMMKDEDLAKAKMKAMELENILRSAEVENQAWQKVAREKEARVINLNNTLQQVRQRVSLLPNGGEEVDAESFCDNRGNQVEQGDEEERRSMACKFCKSRISCVLFLPCRHLCSCKSCEGFLGLCPVCNTAKKASMEVFLQ